MGSKKSQEHTHEVEVPLEIDSHCFMIKSNLNHLETRLETDFNKAYGETAVLHKDLQKAWYDYCYGLTTQIRDEQLRQRGAVESADSLREEVSGFVRYLTEFGNPCFSSYAYLTEKGTRIGVFFKRTGNKKHTLIGFLDVDKEAGCFEYSGYVPIKTAAQEFFGTEVYDSNSNPDLQNYAYIRLVAERSNDGWERFDGWESKGISFP